MVLNLVLMCMPYADQPEEYERAIDQAETVISLLFIVEMALKLLGLGCSGYWSDKWNKLDGTIVLLTSVDLVLSATGPPVGNIAVVAIAGVPILVMGVSCAQPVLLLYAPPVSGGWRSSC